MAMVGGTLVALWVGKNDPGFVHNGPLAGLVAVCAGSDLMHPLGALIVGGVAGGLFVVMFTLTQNRWKIDDVLGVWPLHGLCGHGAASPGLFGMQCWVDRRRQLHVATIGTLMGYRDSPCWRLRGCTARSRSWSGIRLDPEEEFNGADLSIHKITAPRNANRLVVFALSDRADAACRIGFFCLGALTG